MLCAWIASCLISFYYLQMLVIVLSVAMAMLTGHLINGLPMVTVIYVIMRMICCKDF